MGTAESCRALAVGQHNPNREADDERNKRETRSRPDKLELCFASPEVEMQGRDMQEESAVELSNHTKERAPPV
jgi:hypothetical protein